MSLYATTLEQGLTPDIIDETNPDDIFLGFFKYNAQKKPNHCAIKRIKKMLVDGEMVTAIQYPVGRFDFEFNWDQRAGYEYRFKHSPLINSTSN